MNVSYLNPILYNINDDCIGIDEYNDINIYGIIYLLYEIYNI
jgi:hypothetical protein